MCHFAGQGGMRGPGAEAGGAGLATAAEALFRG